MPASRVLLRDAGGDLAEFIAGIPDRIGIDRAFPPDALAEADRLVADPDLPDADATDVELVTIDPPGSRDLDQALALERDGSGWVVHYAIADLPAFVPIGGALDRETRRRGRTLYAADGRIPLHPDSIGEGAASLLPGELRGAYLWRFRCAADGTATETSLTRARVRSRAQLDYPGVQADLDAGRTTGSIALLPGLGAARQALALARGGASLQAPEVDVLPDGTGYRLVRRAPLPVEGWNAELSLMTGMAAARLMLDGGVGILRTMPPPTEAAYAWFRRQSRALGNPWVEDVPYGVYLAGLDPASGSTPAILHAAGALFRGAGYTVVDGAGPAHPDQAAIAAPYAHVTAPIRRLVDRFGLMVCAALAGGNQVPAEVRAALPELPAAMAASAPLAARLEGLTVDTVEAAVLRPRLGETFDATVLSAGHGGGGGSIQLTDPPVTAECDGHLTVGERIRAHLDIADVATARVRFSAVE